MIAPGMEPEPFVINIPRGRLDDLQRRLDTARLALDPDNDDWSYGVNGAYLTELVVHWRETFNWRAQEARMNAYEHYQVLIDSVIVHFLRRPGIGPKPLPLVLTHGWPWTFWDFKDVIDPLADPAAFGGDPSDAFDVIVPSLPGYAFSGPLRGPHLPIWDVADLWVTLMRDVLGYERFAAHGGDMGALVTAQLGHKHADHLIGLHLAPRPLRLDAFNVERPWGVLNASAGASSPTEHAGFLEWERTKMGHVVAQTLDPQTIAFALHDSPIGLAAWLLERRRNWSDCDGDVERVFSKDDLLTNFTLLWLTDSYVWGARQYRDNWTHRWQPAREGLPVVEAPTGITLFTADAPPGLPTDWFGDYFNLQFLRESPVGGHFTPMEQPQRLVEDLREFFRMLRS